MTVALARELLPPIDAALAAIPGSETPAIYVVSFFVYDEDDDPRRPTLTVGYNTIDQWRSSTPSASSPQEAKWNFGFWLQNELLKLGGTNLKGEVVAAWIKEHGLWYSDEEEAADFDRCEGLGCEITGRFVEACCDVAAGLHASGSITTYFGRAIPVLTHELEYYH